MSDPMMHAELKIAGCPAELWLNGIPLARVAPEGPQNVSIPAHLYLIAGVNTIEAVAYPGPNPSAARRGPAQGALKGRAAARVAAYRSGDFTGGANARVLVEAVWDGTQAEPGPFPRIAQSQANLGPMFGRWHWQAAEPLTLDPATVQSAATVLESLRVSLAAGDGELLLSLALNKLANAARAYPARPYEALVQQFRRIVAADAATPGWGFPPLDSNQFDFRLAADGRLLECINRDWRPTLRTNRRPDGHPKYYPLLLCRAGGQWQVGI